MRATKLFTIATGISLLTGLAGPVRAAVESYQFARGFTNEMLLSDKAKREEFVEKFIRSEANFLRPGVGFNALSGLTYDGRPIDFDTGELRGFPKNWSAASKESLHLMVMALAVNGNKGAKILVSPDNPGLAYQEAMSILDRKMSSIEKFTRKYPGFGGYLPWFVVTDRGMEPTWDWEDRVPALDNGQMAWSMMMVAHALKERGESRLSKRYEDHWKLMAKNSVTLFYDSKEARIRGTSKIRDTRAAVTPSNYGNDEKVYHITDPYEGELMTLFMTLYGQWQSPSDVVSVWQSKKMEKTLYRTNEGHKITVRRGFWYSVHEMWNFLVLPYMDDPLIKQVFVNGEKARSWYSAENRIPGLFASVNEPVTGNVSGGYVSAVGIPSLAQVPVTRQDVVTPYAAFPMIMADRKTGLTWLRTMLTGPSMMGPYGATEAASTDGSKIAPLITWDGKITTVLALLGESSDMMRDVLKKTGKYDTFISMIHREYTNTFGGEALEGETLSFRTPTAEIPMNLPDFDVSRKVTDVLRSGKFSAGGDLKADYRLTNDSLLVGGSKGFLWTMIQPTDMSTYRYVNFQVRQDEAHERGFYIELKNQDGQLITDRKVRVKIPYTGEEFMRYSVNVGQLVSNPSSKATLFAFSDPEGRLEFKSATISARRDSEAKLLTYNSQDFSETLALEARAESGLEAGSRATR